MNKKQLIIPMLGMALVGGAITGAIGFAHAQSATTTTQDQSTQVREAHEKHGVAGTVTAVSGSTITLTGKDGKTYTIDASAATIEKIVTINVADIKTGDTLIVGGSVDGTSVKAERIMNGKLPENGGGPGKHGKGPFGDRDGKSGVRGTISAVNGTTLTVAGKDGTTYTVDASNAKVVTVASGAKPTEATLAALVVGDTVGIHGDVNGTTVTAKHIVDGLPLTPPQPQNK